MFNYYMDIHDVSINEGNSMSVVSRIVTVLHQVAHNGHAIDFPQMRNGMSWQMKKIAPVGQIVRVFSDSDSLQKMEAALRGNGFRLITHPCEVGDLQGVPKYKVSGLRRGKSPEKAAARLAAHLTKKGIEMTEPMKIFTRDEVPHLSPTKEQEEQHNNWRKRLDLPYLLIESGSNGHRFPIHIHMEASTAVSNDRFDSYGLSMGGLIPDIPV